MDTGPCEFLEPKNMDPNSSEPSKLTDIHGLRTVWPTTKVPAISTLRRWTKERRLPHSVQGRFIYYDIDAVTDHLRRKRFVAGR